MAVDKKISQLASGAPAQAGDEYVVARSGANYKLTLTNIAASMPPIGATTPNTGAFTTLSASSGATISGGNLTFSSTAQRITGDMSNATHANRLLFQNSGANLPTIVGALPNGTSVTTGFVAYGGSTASDTSTSSFVTNGGTDTRISSGILGTGTYLPMTFYTGGSERVRIDTSGNVGIGTGSPSGRLSLLGDGTQPAIVIDGVSRDIGFPGNLQIGSWDGTTWTERMRIDSSGNVGIGTTTANAKLQIQSGTSPTQPTWAASDVVIAGNSAGNAAYYQSFSDSAGGLIFSTPTTRAKSFLLWNDVGGNSTWQNGSTGALVLSTNGSERMRIDSSGNVGIGGTAAAFVRCNMAGTLPTGSNLSIGFSQDATIPSGTTAFYAAFNSAATTQAASFTLGSYIHYRATQTGLGAGSTVTDQYGYFVDSNLTAATNNYGFHSNIASGSNRWNFYAAGTAENYFAGNTGIGAGPGGNGRLVVAQSANNVTTAGFFSTGSGDVGQRAILVSKYDNDSTTSQVFVQFAINNNGIASGQINANGANSAAFGTWSDARLKENIVDLPPQLANICALRPVEFDYKTGGHQIGFIAQEMQEVYADAVGENSDGMLTITGWSKTEARLVKAIQELTARVAELEAK